MPAPRDTRHIVVDEKLHERLRQDAQAENRSIRAVAERAIRAGLQQKKEGS
jgi:hypothetical protein